MDQQNFEKLKTAYDACLDEDTIKKEGTKPLLEILHQVSDMFPVRKSTSGSTHLSKPEDGAALSDTMKFLYNLGLSPLLSIGAGADDKDPDTVVVQVSPPRRIGLPAKDYYKNEKVVQKYTNTIISIFENLQQDVNGNATEYAQNLVRFESILAAASPDAEDADDVTVSLRPFLLKLVLTTSRNTTTLCCLKTQTTLLLPFICLLSSRTFRPQM